MEVIRVSADIYSSLIDEKPAYAKDIKKDAKELAEKINLVIKQFLIEKGYTQWKNILLNF